MLAKATSADVACQGRTQHIPKPVLLQVRCNVNTRQYLLAALASGICLAAQSGATLAQSELTVGVTAARSIFVHPSREALAFVKARNESDIAAQVTAIVSDVLIDVGQEVRKGSVLAVLDDTDIRLSRAQAQAERDGLLARLQLAERQLKRLKNLKANNFVSTEAVNQRDAEVVTLNAELKSSDARLAVIDRQLDKCAVKAPFDAVVSARSVQLGELTAPGTVLFTLVERGGEEVSGAISTADASHLVSDAAYQFVSRGEAFALTLLRVSPVVASATRTHEARFVLDVASLPSGTEGKVRWPDARPHLPAEVLVRRDGALGIFAVSQGQAGFVVVPGAQEGRPAPVDIAPDVEVVVRGQARLQHGQAVRVEQVGAGE